MIGFQDHKGIVMCASYVHANDRAEAHEQEDVLRRCIARHVHERWLPLEPAYEDVGNCGFTKSPGPALQRLVADARSGDIDIVVVTHPSRLSRLPWVLYDVFAELEAHGVLVFSAAHDRALRDLIPPDQLARTATVFREWNIELASEQTLRVPERSTR